MGAMIGPVVTYALDEVAEEIAAALDKFGAQFELPDDTGITYPAFVDTLTGDARTECQRAAAEGRLTWRHVLTEEVWEAFAESDEIALRRELLQVAAVAARWVRAIDRRRGAC